MKIRALKPAAARSGPPRRRWPVRLFNGRIRTSTVLLIIAFIGVSWVYDTYREAASPPAAPQVVPPGFIPDPAYTWVPRTRLQQPPVTVTETVTPTPTTTETPSPTPPPGAPPTPTPVPGFPFCPPLCPPPPPAGPPTPAPPAPETPVTPPPPSTTGAPQPAAPPGPSVPHG